MTARRAEVRALAGRLADRPHGRAPIFRPGVALMIAGFAAAAVARGPSVPVPALGVIGVGTSLTILPLLALMGDLVSGGSQGTGVGTLQLFGSAGGLVGRLVGTAVLAAIGAAACHFGVAGLRGAIGPPVAIGLGAAERRRSAALAVATPS
jgi:hypothetical protein